MRATFVELPPFIRHRDEYLDDSAYRQLQLELMKNPDAGDVIAGTGGLRKLRLRTARVARASAVGCA